MNRILIVVSFVSVVIHVQSQHNFYCDSGFQCPDDPVDKQHIMCNSRLTEEKKDGVCVGIESAMSEADKKWILGAHNCMRNRLASATVPGAPSGWPQAANMQLITWDDELAAFSRRWAFQCSKREYDCVDSKNLDGLVVMFVHYQVRKGYVSPSYKEGVVKWFQQMNAARPSEVDSLTSTTKSTQEFWVMAMADVYAIGCAFVTFEYQGNDRQCKVKKKGHCILRYHYRGSKLVCSYGPIGLPKAWITGTPCSQCKQSTNQKAYFVTPSRYDNAVCAANGSKFENLCVNPNYPSMNEECILLPLSAPRRTINVFMILLPFCSSVRHLLNGD